MEVDKEGEPTGTGEDATLQETGTQGELGNHVRQHKS